MNDLIVIEYSASVNTPAGWRSVWMKGTAKKISEKRCEVVEITHIDNEDVSANMSRTGAKRQQFNGKYFAGGEKGKKKNISSVTILN
jgi:nitroimidazol reductase NimA-like FMN-containing flavoprotein (pyridoxamine 5'-phosphate oxidase superfamily)